jgi:hypothetical protein
MAERPIAALSSHRGGYPSDLCYPAWPLQHVPAGGSDRDCGRTPVYRSPRCVPRVDSNHRFGACHCDHLRIAPRIFPTVLRDLGQEAPSDCLQNDGCAGPGKCDSEEPSRAEAAGSKALCSWCATLTRCEAADAEDRTARYRSARPTTSINSAILRRCSALLPETIACSTQCAT